MLEVEAGTQDPSVRVGGEWLCCLLVCASVSFSFFFLFFFLTLLCVYDNDMIWPKIKVTFYFLLFIALESWGKLRNRFENLCLAGFGLVDDSVIVMIDGEWRRGLANGDVCCKGFYLAIKNKKKSICQLDKPRLGVCKKSTIPSNPIRSDQTR